MKVFVEVVVSEESRIVRALVVPVLGGFDRAASGHLPAEQSDAVTVTVTDSEVNNRAFSPFRRRG